MIHTGKRLLLCTAFLVGILALLFYRPQKQIPEEVLWEPLPSPAENKYENSLVEETDTPLVIVPHRPETIEKEPLELEKEPPAKELPDTKAVISLEIIPEIETEIVLDEETKKPEITKLQELIDTFCASRSGNWDVHVELLRDPFLQAVFSTKEEPFVSASIIKLFVMATVYAEIENGELDHDVCYPLIYSMITISDNYATNELIYLLGKGDATVGMQLVNDYCSEMGFSDTQLNRLMLANNGLQNYTSAQDCAGILRHVYEGTCVSEIWSKEMISILEEQTVINRIPTGLPKGIQAAHKTGDLIGLCCADVGIVFTPQGDYILCAICNDVVNDYAAATAIAELSAAVYAYFNDE